MTKQAISSNRGSKPGERRGGRAKGTPNKITAGLKEMILGALDKAGGEDYLTRQATTSPAAFMTLVGKVLPLQVQGDDANPLAFTIVERRIKHERPGD